MVDMHSTPIGAQEQLVVGCPNLGEDNSLFGNSAHKFTLLIEDQNLSTFTQKEEEVC